jgi:hypothetical protein
MHHVDLVEKITFGNATFKNIPQNFKEIIEKSKEIQSVLKNSSWFIGKLKIIHLE